MKASAFSAALLAAGCLVPQPAPRPRAPAPAAAPAAFAPEAAARAPSAGDGVHDPAGWFSFPARGVASPDGAADLASLDAAPAGARGFIHAAGGHFVDGAGNRVRFFGVNCTATACLPTHEIAARAALHLRRLGVNVVRFHFMDKGPAPIGLLQPGGGRGPELDPAQLDRLDFFIAELAKNGIYANLNLHVGRRYPGIDGALAQRFELGKLLDRFYPPFLDSQKAYARALLSHENPYLRQTYAASPAVLCVEMNNENTALPFWAGNLDDLPEPFAGELAKQWNAWLRARYSTTAHLRAAWNDGGPGGAPAPELLTNADLAAGTTGWVFESAGVPTRGEVVTTEEGGRALRFSADRRGTASWHLQLYRAHLPLIEGQAYHVSFRVRAPANLAGLAPARALEVLAMLSVPDWRNIGMSRTIALGPTWQRVDIPFRVQNTIAGEGRLNFGLRNVPGVVEIADLSLRAGAPPVALGPNASVERGTIPLIRSEGGAPAGDDFLRFLADTDRATARALAQFIRHDLGLRSMLVDTQASYGGLEGLRRELEVSDFVDMHAYWQHPDFPSGWSALRFSIPNTTQVAAADGGALASLAVYRAAGKPFTVSEYNVPAPNDYAGEALPMYAAIAAVQDWDAIYAYTYLDFSPRWDADHLLGFFDVAGNPAALSFLPVAALTFRTGLVPPARDVAHLAWSPSGDGVPLTGEGALARLWGSAGFAPVPLTTRRMEVVVEKPRHPNGKKSNSTIENPGAPAPDSVVDWKATGASPTFTVAAPALRVAAGAIANRAIDVGDVQLQIGDLPRGDVSIALVALDGKPVADSRRMLLVSVARVENTGMQFRDERHGLLSWGRGPALAEYVPLTVVLPGPSVRVQRLDPAGVPTAELAVAPAADGRRQLRLEHEPSLWFLLTR